MDEARLKESFAQVAAHGDDVALFFYSHLFLGHPELREMFPISMAEQRDRLTGALGRIVTDVSNTDSLVAYLQGLGRDHRKFGTLAEHYPAVGASLLATLAHFSGAAWTQSLADDWTEAYGVIANVMADAAAGDEAEGNPPWWDAVVVGHERRTSDITVLKVAPRQPLAYVPGQSVAVECEPRPRLWRFYSPANAPREDGTIDFHVRLIDGGAVSPALARTVGVGSKLRLGAPVSAFRMNPSSSRDMLLAAGGTGLAPLKAIAEQAARLPSPPATHLVFGVRTAEELYDLPALEKMAAQWPWLTVTAAASDDPGYGGERGAVPDVIGRSVPVAGRDAYVCGSSGMVAATVGRLTSLGMPREQIFVEEFGWSET